VTEVPVVTILESVPASAFATQMALPAAGIAVGAPPTVTVAVTLWLVGSILQTELSCRFVTQMEPAACVIACGSLPTGILLEVPSALSSTTPPLVGATHQTWPNATVRAVTPTAPGSVRTTPPSTLAGSISETVPSAEFATQTLLAPYATAVGPFP